MMAMMSIASRITTTGDDLRRDGGLANRASRRSGKSDSSASSHSATQSIICVSSVKRPTCHAGPVNSGTLWVDRISSTDR
jgi:hypothetical protein